MQIKLTRFLHWDFIYSLFGVDRFHSMHTFFGYEYV